MEPATGNVRLLVLHELKQSGKGQMKTTINYSCLKSFIDFHSLQYLCVPCRLSRDKLSTRITHGGIPCAAQCNNRSREQLASEVGSLCAKVRNISYQLSALQNTLASFDTYTSSKSVVDSSASAPTSAPKQSYAATASKDIATMVKTAVAESLKQHCIKDRSSASFVIYGLTEN